MNHPQTSQDTFPEHKLPEDIANLIRALVADGRLQRIVRFYRALSPNKQRQLHRITRAMLE